MTDRTLTLGLIGPGALGLYYAALLVRAGNPLKLLGRSDFSALNADGITLRKVDAAGALLEKTVVGPAMVTSRPSDLRGVDVLIISSKSTANSAVTAQLSKAVSSENCILLTLQNGMGNVEWLREHFPRNPIVAGLCFVCANRVAPAVVENYLPGRVQFAAGPGTPVATAERMSALFSAAGVQASTSASLEAALWRKLVWNVPFNGLAIAEGGVTTDQLLASASITERVERLMREVQAAAKAHHCEISDDFLVGQVSVTKQMGAYRPSSLIDFLEGKAVELDAIWRIPRQRAHEAGVATPCLDQLVADLEQVCAPASKDRVKS